MRKLILTLAIGDEHERLAKITQPLMQAYAERIGAHLGIINARTGDWSIPWEKLVMYDFLGHSYDRIIFLDNDVLIRPDCPDLFEVVPEDKLGAFDEARFLPREQVMRDGMRIYVVGELPWNCSYYNTGVLVASRKHRHIFKRPEQCIDHYWEQTYLNIAMAVMGTDVHDIRYDLNMMGSISDITGLPMASAHIAHLAGLHRGTSCEAAAAIVESWKETAPGYKYKRRVWLDFAGGLGDVIDAEPVLRFAVEKVFPEEEVRVTTPWPRVFDGYKIPIFAGIENPFGAEGALKLEGCPEQGSGLWTTLSHVTSNATDFASIGMLHQQLPLADKRARLTVKPEDVKEITELAGEFPLEKACLVHPGRSWASRTFPVEWWQEIIDGIAKGAPVVLCGLQGEIHGWLPVEAHGNVLDLRDRTSMGAMFELVKRCPVLLSNDSSPVHIAGAFDNRIILIPSARHPDLVLPVRNGNPYWRAQALYKRLTIEDISRQPCEFYGTHADGPPVRPWDEYLPETEDVISAVLEALKESENE